MLLVGVLKYYSKLLQRNACLGFDINLSPRFWGLRMPIINVPVATQKATERSPVRLERASSSSSSLLDHEPSVACDGIMNVRFVSGGVTVGQKA